MRKIVSVSFGTQPERQEVSLIHVSEMARNIARFVPVEIVLTGPLDRQLDFDGIPVRCYSSRKVRLMKFSPFVVFYVMIKNFEFVAKLFRDFPKTDVLAVYERLDLFYWAGFAYAKLRGLPLIYELNDILDERAKLGRGIFRPVITFIFRFMLSNADAIIVQTNELKEIIDERFNLGNIYVVENGVNMIPPRKKAASRRLRLVFAGHLDELHNISELLQAVSSLGGVELHVIGDGPLMEKYVSLYSGKNIFFHGRKSHAWVTGFLAGNCDLGLLSYGKIPMVKKYGLFFCPFKLLEYSAAGLGSITLQYSNSFIGEFEKKGACILAKDVRDLSDKITELRDNRETVKKMGFAAKKLSEKFTWERAAALTWRVIHEASSR